MTQCPSPDADAAAITAFAAMTPAEQEAAFDEVLYGDDPRPDPFDALDEHEIMRELIDALKAENRRLRATLREFRRQLRPRLAQRIPRVGGD